MILFIDNYDSFTYNLYQQIGALYDDIKVYRNDQVTVHEIREMQPKAIVISPGPGRPEDAGICIDVIQSFYKIVPILGICLGHQAIAAAFNVPVVTAKRIMHGKISSIEHSGNGIFEGLPQHVKVMRYHSLAVAPSFMPDFLSVEAKTADGEIMTLKHREYPLVGVQFHPESIGTKDGNQMIENFLRSTHLIESKEVVQ